MLRQRAGGEADEAADAAHAAAVVGRAVGGDDLEGVLDGRGVRTTLIRNEVLHA